MAESEQIWWAYVKLENRAEIYSARIYSSSKFHHYMVLKSQRNFCFSNLIWALACLKNISDIVRHLVANLYINLIFSLQAMPHLHISKTFIRKNIKNLLENEVNKFSFTKLLFKTVKKMKPKIIIYGLEKANWKNWIQRRPNSKNHC